MVRVTIDHGSPLLGLLIPSHFFQVKAEAIGICDHEPSTVVAVKMPKPPVSRAQMVGMMSEIKIMLLIGKHLNVVNLLGACTAELKKGKEDPTIIYSFETVLIGSFLKIGELLVIVEYCRYGNLQQYLLKRRNKFVNQVDPRTGIYDPNSNRSDGYSTSIHSDPYINGFR